jgi:hypothetical protein
MHLECGSPELAVAVLRRTVFLDPTDTLARYFYALALRETKDLRAACRQLENVLTDLRNCCGEEVLSDQKTTTEELLRSAQFLKEQWR